MTLSERLAEATGASRELDAELWSLWDHRPLEGAGVGPAIYKRDPVDTIAFDLPPPYTASIDSALVLVERVLPGAYGRVEPRFYIDGERVEWVGYTIRPRWDDYNPTTDDWFDVSEARAPTPALALCQALLAAKEGER